MHGEYLAETGHFVNVIPPKDITGGVTGARFKLSGWSHATVLIQLGVTASAPTKIFVRAATLSSGGSTTDLPHTLYAQETVAGDVLGSREAIAATGRTPSANDNIFYVIEIDSRELPAGSPWVEIAITAPAASILASAVAILTGGRMQALSSPTVLT